MMMATAVALLLLALAALLAAWSYLAYPVLLRHLADRASHGTRSESLPGAAEVILSAADEEAVIARRVENLLTQERADGLAITIGCDGCRDGTAQVARAAGGARVRVVEFPSRRGKAAVLNDLVEASQSEVIVFTDANTEFAADAVRRLLEPFGDSAVGAVCGRLQLEAGGEGSGVPETLFWDRETRLKEAEGRLGVCLGANGAIYAARRERIEPLPEDTVMDDFLIPARIARSGARVVFAGSAVAREPAPADVAAERARRFRLGLGGGEVLRREGWLFDFRRHPALTFAFLSRKAARWVAPVLTLLAFAPALLSASLRPAAVGASIAVALLLLLPPPKRVGGPAGKLYYFCLMNLVLAAGVVAGLCGMSRPAWTRTPR